MKGRNFLGQKIRPRRLTPAEREIVVNAIESAINGGRDEIRIYWEDDAKRIHVAPVTLGERILASSR